jgi:hypothetical protein
MERTDFRGIRGAAFPLGVEDGRQPLMMPAP